MPLRALPWQAFGLAFGSMFLILYCRSVVQHKATVPQRPGHDPHLLGPGGAAPRIRILDAHLKEVETVRIEDRLTFRIEIPETSECKLSCSTEIYPC